MKDLFLLTSGSRTWNHYGSISHWLELHTHAAHLEGGRLVVVHGACESGADRLIRMWTERHERMGWPVTQECHPAPWGEPCRERCQPHHRRQRRDGTDFCPTTGNYRNEAMVAAHSYWRGLAFRARGRSNGTDHCIRAAKAAGLDMRVIRADGPDLHGRLL